MCVRYLVIQTAGRFSNDFWHTSYSISLVLFDIARYKIVCLTIQVDKTIFIFPYTVVCMVKIGATRTRCRICGKEVVVALAETDFTPRISRICPIRNWEFPQCQIAWFIGSLCRFCSFSTLWISTEYNRHPFSPENHWKDNSILVLKVWSAF